MEPDAASERIYNQIEDQFEKIDFKLSQIHQELLSGNKLREEQNVLSAKALKTQSSIQSHIGFMCLVLILWVLKSLISWFLQSR
jgi:hypothetical protein